MTETEFKGENCVIRADFAVMMSRMLKYDDISVENFFDVYENDYYCEDILKLKNAGIILGYEDNLFYPKNEISREDIAVIIYRSMEKQRKEDESGLEEFLDLNDVSDYAREAVSYLISNKLMTGSEGKIRPAAPATRAETAVLIWRLRSFAGFQ